MKFPKLGNLFGKKSGDETIVPKFSREEMSDARTWWTKVKNRERSNYDWENKERLLGPLMQVFDEEGMIGNTVLDVGSGPRPLSSLLKKSGRKLMTIDFNPPKAANDFLHVRGDVREVLNPASFPRKRTLLKIAEWLGVDPHSAPKGQIDTMIFSDVLNYVPYQATVREFAGYLKDGGLMIVLNMPGRTFPGQEKLLDPERPKTTSEMMEFLKNLGFTVLLDVPTSPLKDPEDDMHMVFTVLRKEGMLAHAARVVKSGGNTVEEKAQAKVRELAEREAEKGQRRR